MAALWRTGTAQGASTGDELVAGTDWSAAGLVPPPTGELAGEAIDVLVALGLDDEEARRTLERFRAHDESLFEQTWRDRGDEDKLAAAASRGREELERLFEEDAKARRSA